MKVSVLIPFRSQDPQRIKLWNYLRPQWEALAPDVELCTTTDTDDPTQTFSIARGMNRCRAMATGDILLVHGADQLLPTPETWDRIRATMRTAPWMWVYAQWMAVQPWSTRIILESGGDPKHLVLGPTFEHNWAIVAVRPDVWDEIGGFDERFVGWGPEDVAFRTVLRGMYPEGSDVGEGVMYALWHAQAPRDHLERNTELCREITEAAGRGREALREYLAARAVRA